MVSDRGHPQSGKMTNEGRDHLLSDTVSDSPQYCIDGPLPNFGWGFLSKSGVEGRCALHVHFRVGLSDGVVVRNYCAVFNRTPV